jgi:murein DD-endopeptidase MepM/ murein hydrolase activator NlpD
MLLHHSVRRARRPLSPRDAYRGRRGVATFVVTGLLLSLGIGSAWADDIDDRRNAAEKRQAEVLANQESLQEQLEDTDAEMAQAVLDLQVIEARLPVAQAELDAANAEVVRTQREADLLAQRLVDAEAQEVSISAEIEQSAAQTGAAQASIAELARQAYRGAGQVSSLGVITGAQSTDEFVQEYAVSSTAARSQTRTLSDLQATESISRNREARLAAVRDTIAELKVQADQNLAAAQTAQQAAADRKAEVESLVVQQQAKNAQIESRKADALAKLQQVDAAQQSLTSELKGIVAEQQARDQQAAAEAQKNQGSQGSGGGGSNSGGGTSGGSSSGGSSSGGQKPGRGVLAYPTANPHVTSSFGMRLHPVFGIYRLHAGTDFRARCGVPILASAGGTVQFARTLSNGTKQVVIDHGWVNGSSLMTGYLHLTSWTVSPGQRVSQGQLIGYSGNTGVGTGCHLHFEVYVNGGYVDPMTML